MVELKGSLSGIGLLAIVQLIGDVQHSGHLHLDKEPRNATLTFDAGRLVAAECGEHHGLQAVADCVVDLADADFSFAEGIASNLERSLDLGPADLKRLIQGISSGAIGPLQTQPNGTPEGRPEMVCPLLGFADDQSRHYSRPTALHRCYSGGGPSLVSAQEQRDLCLGGRFATCPRYRNAEHAQPAVAALASSADPAAVEPPAMDVPPGVAARLAATSQMRLPTEQPVQRAVRPPASEPEPARPRRGTMLIVAGAALGFLLVGVLMVVVIPRLGRQNNLPSTDKAFEPIAQATRVSAAVIATPPVVAPPARPTLVPTPTAISPLPTPAAQARPAAAVPSGRSLMDVRFAAGPADKWLENPPYVGWSDGAYRFQARDATRFVAVGVPVDQVLSDVVVSATFRKTGGPPGGGYGLIVRDQGPEPRDGVNQDMTAYVLETGDLGEFGVWRRDGDHWVDLVPWTRANSVRSGGSPNELTVRATGDQLTLSVNGVDVATVHDDALVAGRVGVFVGGDYNEAALDRFSVRLPN